MTRKTDYTNINARLLIATSTGLIITGVLTIIVEPGLPIKFEPLELFGEKFGAGWAFCAVGLTIQLIDKIPMIVEALRRFKK